MVGASTVTTCNRCGEQITFRKIDGKTIPIHPNGGCNGRYGGRNQVRVISPQVVTKTVFDDPQSYLNPNAKCPVCGKSVFFYQSEHGGRVFFDDVGWPWPKHPCTDRAAAQNSAAIYAPTRNSAVDGSDWIKNYRFFRLISIRRESGRLYLRVKESTQGLGGFFRSLFSKTERIYSFDEKKLELADLQDSHFLHAPSFLIAQDQLTAERAVIQFICPRKGKIMRLRMKRVDAR
jgi:ribosomal protein S27E